MSSQMVCSPIYSYLARQTSFIFVVKFFGFSYRIPIYGFAAPSCGSRISTLHHEILHPVRRMSFTSGAEKRKKERKKKE